MRPGRGRRYLRGGCEISDNGDDRDDDLIDLVYASLLGESGWNDFLDRLSARLPGGKTVFFFHDSVRNRGDLSLSSGLGEEALRAYGQHYSRINPWMAKASVRPIGLGVVSEQMLDRADLVRTEFYGDFMRSIGAEAAVGVTIVRESGRSLLLSTLTERADPHQNLAAAETLTRLAPHLKRAFRYYQTGPFQKAMSEVGDHLFEETDIGLVIVGDGMTVKTVSAAAARHLEGGEGIGISPTGRITLADQGAARALQQMVDRLAQGPRVHTHVTAASGKMCKITLVKLAKDPISAFFEGPTVAILIEQAQGTQPADLKRATAAFRLTPAEIKVALALDRGISLREAAIELGIAEGTARQQLKSIFRKTGTSRQSELIVWMRSLGPGR
jgi:DNA-binding CsgD family transcriptional regulator